MPLKYSVVMEIYRNRYYLETFILHHRRASDKTTANPVHAEPTAHSKR